MLLESEIAEERSVAHLGIEVRAPNGWVKVTHVCRTIPMQTWRLITELCVLECAGKHLVIKTNGEASPVDSLNPGDMLDTKYGTECVLEAAPTGGTKELYDLRVDSADHIYFTGGIASHNSTGLGAGELYKGNIIPNYKSIYLAPLKEHAKTFADKLMEMQRGSIYPPENALGKKLRNNLYYKEFPKGGSLKLMHVLTDATKLRGNSAGTVVVDECQDFDTEHLPEISQVQKAFRDTKSTIFAGTSKDLDTCLENQFQQGSRGIWNIQCTCPVKWHPLDDREMIPKMMSVDGLRCPINGRLLNPMIGEFAHEDMNMLEMKQVSFHLPQVIVPEYASGTAFMDIWRDFKKFPYKKFLQEVMGIAVDAGMTELTEVELKDCCSYRTFDQIQSDYLSGRVNYAFVFSGCDWGGSDWNPASKTKQSYTVHSIYGLTGDGVMELIYAHRYSGMNYQEIAGMIVEAHNKFKVFGIGTDNGGGSYYNAYLRDCGRIQTNKIITFNYSDTKLVLDRIPHPEAHIFSLHRSDSISALISDVKAQRIRFPRWDDSQGFVSDFLNMRRNITEAPSGKSIMRYVRHGSKADDFMQSSNYACMLKRIVTRESMIPNQQVLDEIAGMFGTAPVQMNSEMDYMGMFGGHISG